MGYMPIHLQPYSVPSNYFGTTWHGWYAVAGMSRDSDTIERSNFRVIEKALRAIPDVEVPGTEDPSDSLLAESGVQVTRCNHFAVGWVDTIYVHGSHEEALKLADKLVGAIADYPILDECDHGTLELEQAADCWERFSLRDRVDACARFDVSIFAARHNEVPEDPRGELISWLAE